MKRFIILFFILLFVSDFIAAQTPVKKAGTSKAQQAADSVKRAGIVADSLKAATKRDTIDRVQNVTSLHDTAKLFDQIAIKLKTDRPVSLFTNLFINGIRVPNTKAVKVSECDKTLFFKLGDSVKVLLESFTKNENTDMTMLPVDISVGTADGCLAVSRDKFFIEVRQTIQPGWIWAMSILVAFLVILGLYNGILKDDNNVYYSLSRTQLFLWTFIFIISYVFICFKTGTLPAIPGSMLVIFGISLGTTGFSKVMDDRNKNLVNINLNAKSDGFLMDILSDASGINIQRFQNVVFNVVFAMMFIQKAIATCALPSFDDNVLLLMGISSGAYAGLKKTEPVKDQPEELPPTPDEPQKNKNDEEGKKEKES